MIVIEGVGLRAEIASRGTELVRLQDSNGRDLLWSGDPKWWANHSPLLFPIVGRVPDDKIKVDGKTYPLLQHGFARSAEFALLRADGESCAFRLEASDETLARYPFQFGLDVEYAIENAPLHVRATVRNQDRQPMPFSFGFHPAFNWPLPFGGSRGDYQIAFDVIEGEPVRRTVDGLLCNDDEATPVSGKILHLNAGLFERGVTIFPHLQSRAVAYGAAGRPRVRVEIPDCPHLGIWTKPGANFVCIEPWQGYAAPSGFNDELKVKPGIMTLDPGDNARFEMRINLQEA
jgi:galactose mutarotase-like enzyme